EPFVLPCLVALGLLVRIRLAPQCDFLLLEVATILLIHKNKVQVVFERELVVDVAVGRRQIEWSEEKPDWDRFTYIEESVIMRLHKGQLGAILPRTGAPSMISNFVTVSLSLYKFGPTR